MSAWHEPPGGAAVEVIGSDKVIVVQSDGVTRSATVDQLHQAKPAPYEEGNWTPVPFGLMVVGLPPVLSGTFTRVGRLVNFELHIGGRGDLGAGNTHSSSAVGTLFTGLPYTAARMAPCVGISSSASAPLTTVGYTYGANGVWPGAWGPIGDTMVITGSYRVNL